MHNLIDCFWLNDSRWGIPDNAGVDDELEQLYVFPAAFANACGDEGWKPLPNAQLAKLLRALFVMETVDGIADADR